MIYVDLSLSKIKEKLVDYGLTRTTSKRFIRYEIRFSNNEIVGVEISKYHNIYELMFYATIFNHNDRVERVDKLENDLKNIFKEKLIY